MRTKLTFCMIIAAFSVQADTMEHFVSIFNEIPKMEIKADPQSQAWARSARNVLAVTTETIAETLMQANEYATSQGKPLFCLPISVQLNSATMSDIIVKAYQDLSSQQSDKGKMTVSQIAWLGVTKNYPCQQQQGATFQPQSQPNTQPPLFNAASNIKTMQHVSAGE